MILVVSLTALSVKLFQNVQSVIQITHIILVLGELACIAIIASTTFLTQLQCNVIFVQLKDVQIVLRYKFVKLVIQLQTM